jgi:hypothetical protein
LAPWSAAPGLHFMDPGELRPCMRWKAAVSAFSLAEKPPT